MIKKLTTTPKADGFHMPGEFEKHKGTVMIWPVRPGSWPYGGKEAQKVFTKIAKEIAKQTYIIRIGYLFLIKPIFKGYKSKIT